LSYGFGGGKKKKQNSNQETKFKHDPSIAYSLVEEETTGWVQWGCTSCERKRGDPRPRSASIIRATGVSGESEKSIVNPSMMMEGVNERSEFVLREEDIFVFAAVDGTLDLIGLVVIHGVTDRSTAEEVADTRLTPSLVFAKKEMKMIREQKKSVKGDRGGPESGGIPFGNHGLGG